MCKINFLRVLLIDSRVGSFSIDRVPCSRRVPCVCGGGGGGGGDSWKICVGMAGRIEKPLFYIKPKYDFSIPYFRPQEPARDEW